MVGSPQCSYLFVCAWLCFACSGAVSYIELTLKWMSCHFNEIFVTSFAEVVCHFGKFQCSKWWNFRQYALLHWTVNTSAGWPTGHSTSYFFIIFVCNWAVLFWLLYYFFLNYIGIRLKTNVTLCGATERLNNIQIEYLHCWVSGYR